FDADTFDAYTVQSELTTFCAPIAGDYNITVRDREEKDEPFFHQFKIPANQLAVVFVDSTWPSTVVNVYIESKQAEDTSSGQQELSLQELLDTLLEVIEFYLIE
uniref:Uncharacterized protein n=1 Tax=Plectus sambesii TaxID=2011161 RepID=A0A914VCB8_9BILA